MQEHMPDQVLAMTVSADVQSTDFVDTVETDCTPDAMTVRAHTLTPWSGRMYVRAMRNATACSVRVRGGAVVTPVDTLSTGLSSI
jgi:hypothetical protein